MRLALILLSLCLVNPALSAFAQSAPTPAATPSTRGLLPEDQKPATLPQPSDAQIAAANVYYANCAADANESSYYDCSCMRINYLQQLVLTQPGGGAPGKHVSEYAMNEKARSACPNTAGIAGATYSKCMTWAPKMFTDYEAFCTCYGNDYAKRFARNMTTNIKLAQILMTDSMQACNAGSAVTERLGREKRIESMKRTGEYEALFPSARELDKPIPLPKQAPPPRPARISPAQLLNSQLFGGEPVSEKNLP